MSQLAFQDQISGNHCWGCGPLNDQGLQIKSYWSGENESICTWQPEARFMAGPQHILNGGIIATLIDCHCVCTAIAAAYRAEGRAMDSHPLLWYATGSLNIKYLRPTPIDETLTLRATVEKISEKKIELTCTLSAQDQICATGEVIAVRVPLQWLESA